jgi:hypothetical protein
MPTDQRIDYIELPAADFDAFEAFYAATFGWTFVDYGPDYRAFNDGQLDGGIFRSELRSTTEHGAALVILYATDLETTREKIIANGGTICRETFEFPGGRRFQFFDPHGNELGVWSDK